MGAKYTKAQAEASLRYKEKLDIITLKLPRGTKEKYKYVADKEGKSLTQFLYDVAEKYISEM